MSIRYTSGESEHCCSNNNHSKLSNRRSEYEREEQVHNKSAHPLQFSNCHARDHAVRQLNGWKLFTAVILHLWRKKGRDLKELLQSLKIFKEESIKNKNQLHIYNSIIRVEQKRNDELVCQLKRSLDTLGKSKSSCEKMTNAIISLKAEKSLLEEELKTKYKEYDALHAVCTQTKTELFRSMMEQRNLQSQLCKEQRTVQLLEDQKSQLVSEISDPRKISETLRQQLDEKQAEINCLKSENADTKQEQDELTADYIPKMKYDDLTNEITMLRTEIISLKHQLDDTLVCRLLTVWKNIVKYQKSSFRYVHIIIFYLLPATPPPLKYVPNRLNKCKNNC